MADTHSRVETVRMRKKQEAPSSLIKIPVRVRFVHFDFKNDAIFARDEFFGNVSVSRDARTAASRWKPIGQTGDTLSSFINQGGPARSITDIYHAVRKAPRGSLIDVSLYSHGFLEGPVVANTNDPGGEFSPSVPRRSLADHDGRVRTDFFPNMGEDPNAEGQNALVEFRGGFASGAVFRIFGCNVQETCRGD